MNQYYPDHVLTIPNATPETKDAAQYMFYKGKRQFNLCGEFCVAYCMKDTAQTDSIDEFLNYWEAKSTRWFKTLFKNGLARTTGIYDLDKMLEAYGCEIPSMKFASTPKNPAAINLALEQYRAIVGVKIDYGGYLVGNGIPHWVVLERLMVIDNTHAICDIYNPFTNAMEAYSWRELMISTGAYKQGIWVKR